MQVLIRGLTPEVRAELERRAHNKGKSLTQYLIAELTHLAEQPTAEDWIHRIEARPVDPQGW